MASTARTKAHYPISNGSHRTDDLVMSQRSTRSILSASEAKRDDIALLSLLISQEHRSVRGYSGLEHREKELGLDGYTDQTKDRSLRMRYRGIDRKETIAMATDRVAHAPQSWQIFSVSQRAENIIHIKSLACLNNYLVFDGACKGPINSGWRVPNPIPS